jgi:hypothetical protein
MSLTVDEYLALVTNEHSDRPKFMASLRAALEQMLAANNLVAAVEIAFDIDDAIGVQLDILGEWIGRTRFIGTPLVGAYFSWDDTVLDGWDSGVWKDLFDPDSGLVSLPDDSYRILLKAKIAANHWDGSIPGAYAVWAGAFGASPALLIQDNQDMTMLVGIVGPPLDAVTKALLTGGYIPLKPEGVRVNYVVSPDTGPLFAWDVVNGVTLDGWETGRWGIEL